jgi:hypothetical protein
VTSPAPRTKTERPTARADEAMTWPLRLLVAVVSLVVLAVAGVICLVVIGSQIGFYEQNLKVKSISFAALGLDAPLHLPTFTPLATEGLVWATTLLALVMVLLGRTATLWTRSMWFFASVAAFVATWHTVTEEGDLFGGILRGSLSLAGPFLVHLTILWARHLRTGRTLTQARVDTAARWTTVRVVVVAVTLLLGRHVAHPVIAVRALSYRLGVAHWSYGDAWAAASVGYRRRVQQRLEVRHSGGFKRLQPRVVETTEKPADKPKPDAAGPPSVDLDEVFPPSGVTPAFIDGEVAQIAAWLERPDVTADAFVDLRKPAAGGDDRQATETAAERRPKSGPKATDDATGPRPKAAGKPTGGTRAGGRPRPVGRANRPSLRRPKPTDVDVTDLLPAAREVATELGDRLSRDTLVEGLRNKGLSVGGQRRAAIYNAIKAEREK